MGEEYKELILFFFRVNHQDNLFNTLNAVCRLKQVRGMLYIKPSVVLIFE